MSYKTLEERRYYQRKHRATESGKLVLKRYGKSEAAKKANKKYIASNPSFHKAGGAAYARKVARAEKYKAGAYCGKSKYTLEEEMIIKNWTGLQYELAILLCRTLSAIEHKVARLKHR